MDVSNQQMILENYRTALEEAERSLHTIEKYMRDIRCFQQFLAGRVLCKREVLHFKAYLLVHYAPSSVNSMLAALNGFFSWLQVPQYRVKPLKIQRDLFAQPDKELHMQEYQRLLAAAERHPNKRLSLLIQTICATGIRVSELQFITVHALQMGRTVVCCKGKNRVVFIPKELCKQLKVFAKARGIRAGSVFVTKSGKPLERSNIWKMMKSLCKKARVAKEKVFPHNLRHLFARTYYKKEKDISKLADILGHGNVNTTRIYTKESGAQHERQLNRLGLFLSERMIT